MFASLKQNTKVMTITSKISKRDVMTRAWRIFRGKYKYSDSFGECLRRAWEVEKENAAYRAEQAAIEAEINRPRVKVEFTEEQKASMYQAKVEAMARYYDNWAYSGD